MRLALPSAIAALAFAGRPAAALPRRAPLPRVQLEDFRRPAGIRVADTLNAAFSIREVRWRPEGPTGAELSAFAFVEDGQLAKVPGPLLRAPAGTLMRVTLHNTLGVQIVVFGLQDHAPNKGPDSLTLAAGARASVSFRVTTAGTYYYWARLRPAVQHPTAPVPDDWPSGEKGEGPLVGALVVDAAGTVPPRGERILAACSVPRTSTQSSRLVSQDAFARSAPLVAWTRHGDRDTTLQRSRVCSSSPERPPCGTEALDDRVADR